MHVIIYIYNIHMYTTNCYANEIVANIYWRLPRCGYTHNFHTWSIWVWMFGMYSPLGSAVPVFPDISGGTQPVHGLYPSLSGLYNHGYKKL